MDELQPENVVTEGIEISVHTKSEENKSGKVKKKLRTATAVIAFICAAVAIAAIVSLYFGVLNGKNDSSDYTAEQSAAVFLLAVLGVVFGICMVIVSISCVCAGLLIITNAAGDKAKYIWGAVMGIFDAIAIALISVGGATASIIGGQWFVAFVAPFAVDLVMSVVCAVYCIVKKEKQNG